MPAISPKTQSWVEEAGHVLVGQGVVEWAVPRIEPDLHVGCGADDYDEPACQCEELVALVRNPERRSHPDDVREQTFERGAIRVVGAL